MDDPVEDPNAGEWFGPYWVRAAGVTLVRDDLQAIPPTVFVTVEGELTLEMTDPTRSEFLAWFAKTGANARLQRPEGRDPT